MLDDVRRSRTNALFGSVGVHQSLELIENSIPRHSTIFLTHPKSIVRLLLPKRQHYILYRFI
jgi:hypothetical protein